MNDQMDNVESPPLAALDGTVTDTVLSLEDFYADMKSRQFIYVAARELWPAASVDARIPPVPVRDVAGHAVLDEKGKPKKIAASKWLATNRPVEQMSWVPGAPLVIRDKLISEGWIERQGASVFNLYRAPTIELGDPTKAGPWLDHIEKTYPNDAGHIEKWLAHRRQRPDDKVNHALVLGGNQGIGKDTIIEATKPAIGPWNFQGITPRQLLGRFNGFVKSVILHISEARNLGDIDRFAFYEVTKNYIAAPPDVLRVDEKNLREYSLPNCCGVIITTNYKTNGIYLPADDRRHYVAWSDLNKEDFDEGYWNRLYDWYRAGGYGHIAAYLDTLDISDFDAKAPPLKTEAFWAIAQSNRSSEDSELEDLLDELDRPDAFPLSRLMAAAKGELAEWMRERGNRRAIPHKLESCGYSLINNSSAKDGYWRVGGRRQPVYGKKELSERERLAAIRQLTTEVDWSEPV
jgi:hypothetical protein